MVLWFEWIVYSLIGLAGIAYALNSHNVRLDLEKRVPNLTESRKIIFVLSLGAVLLGCLLSYTIGAWHNLITLAGSWLILLASAPWFNRRIMRRNFDRDEMKVIRSTMFVGLFILVLSLIVSTGFFILPPHFSPGTFFMGVAILVLAGRLWWNMDPAFSDHLMVQSKRNYS